MEQIKTPGNAAQIFNSATNIVDGVMGKEPAQSLQKSLDDFNAGINAATLAEQKDAWRMASDANAVRKNPAATAAMDLIFHAMEKNPANRKMNGNSADGAKVAPPKFELTAEAAKRSVNETLSISIRTMAIQRDSGR